MPKPRFRLPLDEVLAAITPKTRVVFLTNPNNPTGVAMPLDAIRTIARRVPAGAIVFVDEAYAEFAGVSFIPGARRVSERRRRPDVLEGVRPGRHSALAALLGAPECARSDSRGGPRLQRQHRGGRRRAGGAHRDLRLPGALSASGERVESAALRGLRSPRPDVLEERREFRARARGRPHDGTRRRAGTRASTCATGPPSRAAPAASASPPASSSTRGARIAVMEEVLCAAP